MLCIGAGGVAYLRNFLRGQGSKHADVGIFEILHQHKQLFCVCRFGCRACGHR